MPPVSAVEDAPECADDLLIAQMLQMQFDKEFDDGLKHEERHQNGASKVTVSYSKYRAIPDNPIWNDEDEDAFDLEEGHLDAYETADRNGVGEIPKCGYKKDAKSGEFVTKHDKDINGRSNGKRLLRDVNIETGDGGGIDMKLSNAVFNDIRKFSAKEMKRKTKIKDKTDKATAVQAEDQPTRHLLFITLDDNILISLKTAF